MRVHVFTSPHLVSFNERIRVAGRLVGEDELAAVLEEVEAANAGEAITVFELVTAAAFVLFARTAAELCVLEVGLGGRGDATNVIPPPAAAAITSISMDHREFLGDTLAEIAAEKAGIVKPDSPVVTGRQSPEVFSVLRDRAGAALLARDRDWSIEPAGGGLRYADEFGALDLPPPSLLGEHQHDNAGIAICGLRAAGFGLTDGAIRRGVASARWPARLQRLHGALADMLPASELWLDGGHNAGAGSVLARHLATWRDRPTDLIIGMKQTKDSGAFLAPLLPHARRVWAVAEPGQHLALSPEAIVDASGGVARPGPTVASALRHVAEEATPAGRVLICGSLYLAGEVLRADARALETAP